MKPKLILTIDKVIGYRSPRVKMQPEYYPLLKKFGYQYDSSIYGTTKFDFRGIKILPYLLAAD